jgi:hypothetical protein
MGILAQNPETADMGAQLGFQKMFAPAAEGPKQTSAMQEYEIAKGQGFEGTFLDYQKALAEARRPQTNVNVNSGQAAPPRYLTGTAAGLQPNWRFDTQTGIAEPIPGGPAAAEAAALAEKADTRQGMKETQAAIVTDDIGKALTEIEASPTAVTGLMGSALAIVPGTPAFDLNQRLMTIGANIGFDKLQAMREASPTGGALGSVSDFENRQLQATYGALAQSQSAEQLAENLRRLHNVYNDIVHGPGNGPPRFNLQTGRIEAAPSAPAPAPSAMPAPTAPGGLPAPPPGFEIVR